MTSDENGIRMGEGRDILFQEIADMDIDARSTKTTTVFLDDGFALRTDFKGDDLKMRELETSLDRDAACAEADVPEYVSLWKLEGLKRQQTDGHLGDHLLSSVEQGEFRIRNAKIIKARMTRIFTAF